MTTCEEFTGQPCTCPQPRSGPPSASGFATTEGPFRIYRNLNKHCWSVQHRPGMGIQGWRVLDHRSAIICTDATFKVSEAGRQRVLSTGYKNVHAYILTANLLTPDEADDLSVDLMQETIDPWVPITYDPRKHSTFVTLDGQPISKARAVALTFHGQAFAHQPT